VAAPGLVAPALRGVRGRPRRRLDQDFGANAIVRFDPRTEQFQTIELPSAGASVRQLLGRPGELWGAESGVDKLVVVRTG
jgi:streptogramin lyase